MCQTRETAREAPVPHPVGVPLRYPVGSRRSGGWPWSGWTVRRERWPAAQDAVFRRLLPMARAVAIGAVPAGGPVDPGAGERAAESGLARAVARWWSADGAGFEVFASHHHRGGVGPAVRDGLRQGAGDCSRRPVRRTPDGPPAGMSDTAVACRRACPHRRAEPSRGVRRPCSAMGAILRFGGTSQGRVQSQSRPPRSTKRPTEASGPNVPNQPRCRMSHICWRNTLPRITRRRTRPSTAAREDFCTPSSGIAHVPGQAWTRNRLAHTKGSRPVRIMQGQDPVEEVRS